MLLFLYVVLLCIIATHYYYCVVIENVLFLLPLNVKSMFLALVKSSLLSSGIIRWAKNTGEKFLDLPRNKQMWISREIKFANETFRGTPIFSHARAFHAPVENYLGGYEYSIINDNQRWNPFSGLLHREKYTLK